MSDWRSIETAPKDGTPILVYYDSGNIELIEGSDSYDWQPYEHSPLCDTPQFWMPLPDPPLSTGGSVMDPGETKNG